MNLQEITYYLARSPIFFGIAVETIEKLLESVQFQYKKFGAGSVIACREEPCNNLLILLSGSVKGEMIDVSGKVIKIEDICAPFPLTPAFVFGMNNRYPVDIIANETVELISINRNSYLKLLQQNTQVLLNYLNIISNRAQFLSQKLFFLSFRTIREKLANFILSLSNEKNEILLPDSHQQLAELFGVTRPSLSRGLMELEKEGCIKVERRKIEITNREKLKQLIN